MINMGNTAKRENTSPSVITQTLFKWFEVKKNIENTHTHTHRCVLWWCLNALNVNIIEIDQLFVWSKWVWKKIFHNANMLTSESQDKHLKTLYRRLHSLLVLWSPCMCVCVCDMDKEQSWNCIILATKNACELIVSFYFLQFSTCRFYFQFDKCDAPKPMG